MVAAEGVLGVEEEEVEALAKALTSSCTKEFRVAVEVMPPLANAVMPLATPAK